MTTIKVSKELSSRIHEQRDQGKTEKINVTITLKKAVEPSRLKAAGLKVTNVSQAGLWVSGAITADNLGLSGRDPLYGCGLVDAEQAAFERRLPP